MQWPHPGEILLHELLEPMGLTADRLAQQIGVPPRHVHEIVAGTRSITADTGLRLSTFFGMSDGFWTGLQANYDAATERRAALNVQNARKPQAADESADIERLMDESLKNVEGWTE